MRCLGLVVLILVIMANIVCAEEVKSLKVKGITIKVGDTFDNVLTKLPKKYMTSQSKPSPDPTNPDSFVLTKKYNVNGSKFDLIVGRSEDPGPFRVRKIIRY